MIWKFRAGDAGGKRAERCRCGFIDGRDANFCHVLLRKLSENNAPINTHRTPALASL